MTSRTPSDIASVITAMLQPQLVDPNAPACWLWAREDRAVVSINPNNVRSISTVLSDKWQHDLSTRLGGVRVVKTNTRGVFYQIGYDPLPPVRLLPRPLDLSQQPIPLAVPIGVTAQHPAGLWLSITDLVSVLIGGSRRMGKTRLLHAWIQSLLTSSSSPSLKSPSFGDFGEGPGVRSLCDLVLYDGKDGLEFHRYASAPNVTYTADLDAELQRLSGLVVQRASLMRELRAPDLASYNARVAPAERLPVVVLIIDEAALVTGETADRLAKLIAVSGAHGIIPVLATQRTGASEVSPLAKTNLVTRISFSVPAVQDSLVILGRPGAEKLPNTPGRLLITHNARLVTAQAPLVDLPDSPALTVREADLARWALANTHGRLSIPLLVKDHGLQEREARELLDTWAARGWLTGAGQGVARRVSPEFEAMLGNGM